MNTFFLACCCRGPPIVLMRKLPHTRGCFVCGESNAVGLNLRFETDGQVVSCKFVPREEHIGFRHVVHGGLISSVLDEIMVWACVIRTRRFAYCAELNVRFVLPARPGEELTATGDLVANRRERLFEARAELKSAARGVIASSSGKYLPIKETDVAAMAEEFVEDSEWLWK